MKRINLRDYYPFYMQDTFLEVSDEVAQAMSDAERLERNHIRRMFCRPPYRGTVLCRQEAFAMVGCHCDLLSSGLL